MQADHYNRKGGQNGSAILKSINAI